MGYKINAYRRDELRKLSLPGSAVSTLFWVLPIGKWRASELDAWWHHFVNSESTCRKLGLLLVKDDFHAREQSPNGHANLGLGFVDNVGGNLLDLIPEIDGDGVHSEEETQAEKSFLILSGAYPQPGWGVQISNADRGCSVSGFESLIEEVVTGLCPSELLENITLAADAYHTRFGVLNKRPTRPRVSDEVERLKAAVHCITTICRATDEGDPSAMQGLIDRNKKKFEDVCAEVERPSQEFWIDLANRIKQIRIFSGFLRNMGLAAMCSLANDYFMQPESNREAYARKLDMNQNKFIAALKSLKANWPDLRIEGLEEFLRSTYREDIRRRIEVGLNELKSILTQRLVESSIMRESQEQNFQDDFNAWGVKLREAEAKYRACLPGASQAQWELGPRLLFSLENKFSSEGFRAKSFAWDPARMIGWKLYISQQGILPKDLLVAAKTVLAPYSSGAEFATSVGSFNGSLFADYAYYVSISANRLSPWASTQKLLAELLAPGHLQTLLSDESFPLSISTKEQLAGRLLQKWGWHDNPRVIRTPLAGCISGETSSEGDMLVKAPNETRISLEGFLKDLVKVTFSTLGWGDSEIEDQLQLHCVNYRRGTRGPWKNEMDKLTSGNALLLLQSLWVLGFPEKVSGETASAFCATCRELLRSLNSGSHDPLPPPPTSQQLKQYAEKIGHIVRDAQEVVGEMPWHLTPVQSYNAGLQIITGHAWSHSHREERIIRVLLASDARCQKEMLVWNRTLVNPVMTDAILL